MADALLSPGVGAGLWAAAAGLVAWSSRRLQRAADDRRVPLMGVLGAFVFAAQMVNFAIPGTGSSGHLGGGLLLAILLGPHVAVLVIASVLTVQALFFADGGLLALGCNIVNLALFPAFVAYPLVYCRIAGDRPGRTRLTLACVAAAIVGLQLGALAVVLETTASGISALPPDTFMLFMQPIHLAIGVVEGLVTASVIAFVLGAQPDLLQPPAAARRPLRGVVIAFAAAALVIGGIVSGFASQQPDGLEWSAARAAGGHEIAVPDEGGHSFLATLQRCVAVLPDYGFRGAGDRATAARLGTSVAGLAGGLMTLVLAFGLGFWLRPRTPQR